MALICGIAMSGSRARTETEFGVSFGPLLPSRISGVREVLNGVGAHGGILTSKGFFEVDYFTAHGDGIDYHTVGVDYRLDVVNKDVMPETRVHFILGFNGDYFKPSTTSEFRQSGGWHYGGGVRIPLGGTESPFQLRADFKHRFGPGNSLIVLIGFAFITGTETAKTP